MTEIKTKTFVSFSSRDAFVSKLLSRLSAHDLNIWDYSIEREEIPGGVKIDDYLRERVCKSTFFLPIVSPNSMNSPYTRAEVESALVRWREGALRIIPLVERSATKLTPWSSPYDALKGLRYYEFSCDDALQIEELISRVCQDMGIAYVAPVADTPRLPLMARVETELRSRFPREQERTNALFARLDKAIRTCKVRLTEGDHAQALKAIDYFLAMVENEYQGDAFYYPYVARAVCLISVGQTPVAAQLLTSLQSHPACEESVYGALGHIRQSQGLFAEAASLYREALRRDPSDAAAATGVVVNEVFAGEPVVDLVKACAVIEKGTYLSEDEREGAKASLALGLAKLGQSARATEIWSDLAESGKAPVYAIINLANVLVDMNRLQDAQHLLTRAMSDHPGDLSLARWTTRLFMETGQPQQAIPCAQRATQLEPQNLEVWFDLLLAERRAGLRQSTETAKRLASMLPRSKEDFYYVGYANRVLGRTDRSQYDLERSGSPDGYQNIE